MISLMERPVQHVLLNITCLKAANVTTDNQGAISISAQHSVARSVRHGKAQKWDRFYQNRKTKWNQCGEIEKENGRKIKRMSVSTESWENRCSTRANMTNLKDVPLKLLSFSKRKQTFYEWLGFCFQRNQRMKYQLYKSRKRAVDMKRSWRPQKCVYYASSLTKRQKLIIIKFAAINIWITVLLVAGPNVTWKVSCFVFGF